MHIHQTDLVIIGAGPVGLFAILTGMMRIKSYVIDSLEDVGANVQRFTLKTNLRHS